jgi:hypothetical protein
MPALFKVGQPRVSNNLVCIINFRKKFKNVVWYETIAQYHEYKVFST